MRDVARPTPTGFFVPFHPHPDGPRTAGSSHGHFPMMIAPACLAIAADIDEAVPEPGSGIGFRNGVQPMSKQRVVGATLTADQSKLVEHMAPLVERIAYHFMVRLRPACRSMT